MRLVWQGSPQHARVLAGLPGDSLALVELGAQAFLEHVAAAGLELVRQLRCRILLQRRVDEAGTELADLRGSQGGPVAQAPLAGFVEFVHADAARASAKRKHADEAGQHADRHQGFQSHSFTYKKSVRVSARRLTNR